MAFFLGSRLPSLELDRDIQGDMYQLDAAAKQCVGAYRTLMRKKGVTLLIEKTKVMTAENPCDINIATLNEAIQGVVSELTHIKANVLDLQTGVHSNIAHCQERSKKHEEENEMNQTKLDTLINSISATELEMQSANEKLDDLKTKAKRYEKTAVKLKSKHNATNRKAASVVTAAATFSVEMILTLLAGGGVATAAKDMREEKGDPESEITDLVKKLSTYEKGKKSTEKEMNKVFDKIENLSRTMDTLGDFIKFLLECVTQINYVLAAFQDMETCFKEVRLQTHSFKIIQCAFKKDPVKLKDKAQLYLGKLKDKWEVVEQILVCSMDQHVSSFPTM